VASALPSPLMTQIKKPRDESISDFVGSMDGSVAGLMRQAKSSSLFLDASSEASSVAPAEQDAPAPATPEPRQEVDSSAIPSQIRKLSDSFSSFARPTKSEEEES